MIFTPEEITYSCNKAQRLGFTIVAGKTFVPTTKEICPLAAAFIFLAYYREWLGGMGVQEIINSGWKLLPQAFAEGFVDEIDRASAQTYRGFNHFLYALGGRVAELGAPKLP